MASPAALSDLLGYASIGCWLGAQFPQVLENIRRQSCDGLALPFLFSWLLGDATNLLGCILTHQLPFQTYLATYFCFVDFTLLAQFFYYRSISKPILPPFLHGRQRTGSIATRRISIERAPIHYRTLSNVAANVAAAAALAAEQEEQSRWHRHSLERPPYSTIDALEEEDDDDEVSEEALARLADSFHSEGGRSRRGKKVSWSQERRGASLGRSQRPPLSPPTHIHSSLLMTAQADLGDAPDILPRGRPLSRGGQAADEEEDELDWSGAQRRSSRASRKGASMVFMGVWALFGIGTLAGGQRVVSDSLSTGRVLHRAEVPVPYIANSVPTVHSNSLFHVPEPTSVVLDFVGVQEDETFSAFRQPPPSTEFIIGRISAWVCTTLYLTSRLPQIWKNFVRKSVEGLSIYLFIFAFLGNLFYVASILASPKLGLPAPEASAFIRESTPYLLGSGGTLMFDVIIVMQAHIYRAKPHGHGRRNSRTVNEEEAGLLSAGATGAEDSTTPSRRRMGSSTEPDGI
ncbi:PQ loop repeat-domain-containing protein [Sparassis latifolia]|uniref:PQ-loop-domain-containing protein n=1 Tax=Sparassis crispa TaxID=139825 RepID=A0A401GJ28_9APHY|nr:hypothetical protein SCP_0405490 [Sparassis crispa]GBE82169.1 hypothetical protein SCP_0405490 [Sparassis crispa]